MISIALMYVDFEEKGRVEGEREKREREAKEQANDRERQRETRQRQKFFLLLNFFLFHLQSLSRLFLFCSQGGCIEFWVCFVLLSSSERGMGEGGLKNAICCCRKGRGQTREEGRGRRHQPPLFSTHFFFF